MRPDRPLHKAALHLELLVCGAAARLLVKSRGIEPTLRRLARPGAGWGSTAAPNDAVRAARRLHRFVGRGTCLEESAALAAVLARRGGTPDLIVGCRRYPDGTWGAHAWVVADGVRCDLVPAGEHAALTRYSLDSGWRAEALTQ